MPNFFKGQQRTQREVQHVVVTHELSEPTKSLAEDFISAIRQGGDANNNSDVVQAVEHLANQINRLEVQLGEISARQSVMEDALDQQVIPILNELKGKVETMSSNIDRIEKEAADAAENVGLVRTAIEDLKTVAAEMKAEIAALKEQVAKGQLDQARLDAAATKLEKADDDLDAIVLPGGGGPA